MKLTKKIYHQFNHPDTALIISGYPESGSKGKNHGIAWYTKKTIEPIAKKYGKRFIVLAERGVETQPTLHADGKVLVLRVFDNKTIHLYPQILKTLNSFSQIKEVFVHSEFGMKGGIWHFALLIPFLLLIRLSRKNITFFSHNVIDNVATLGGHLNIKAGSLKEKAINIGLRVYYWSLALMCQKIVVLDESIASRLTKFVPNSKVLTLPMGVDVRNPKITTIQAKHALGIPEKHIVITAFGFVSWYKGTDWLIKSFDQLSKQGKAKDIHLLIAGGPSYSLEKESYYQKYYQELQTIAARNPQITMTGFVKDQDLSHVFCASDMVVFPYRGLMGASGCLSHALSYKKPFMISQAMNILIGSSIWSEVLQDAEMPKSALAFSHTTRGLEKIIDSARNSTKLEQLQRVATHFAEKRKTSSVIHNEYEALYASNKPAIIHSTAFHFKQTLLSLQKLWTTS